MKYSSNKFIFANHYILFFIITNFLFFFSSKYKILPVNEAYPHVKYLPSGEYFVIMNKGIYIYNNDFYNSTQIYNFDSNEIIYNSDDNRKTVLSEFNITTNYYILFLYKENIYLFNFNKTDISKIGSIERTNNYYYNLIPYKLINNCLYYIIIYINQNEEKCHIHDYPLYKLNFFHYKICFNENTENKYENKLINNNDFYIFEKNFIIGCESFISNLIFSCNIFNQEYIICFYTSSNSEKLIASKFNINNNLEKDSYNKEYDFSHEINGIKSSLSSETNYILVGINYKYGTGNIASTYLIFDIKNFYFTNLFSQPLIDKDNLEIFYFEETNSFIIVANDHFNNFFIYKINETTFENDNYYQEYISESREINSFYLHYNHNLNGYNLISDCITDYNQWNIIYNISIFTSVSPTIIPPTELIIEDNYIKPKEDNKIVFNQTKEELFKNIDEILNNEINVGDNYEIFGNGFNLFIRPTNSSFPDNSTHINFEKCEKTLRDTLNISYSRTLTIFQLELENDDDRALTNKVEYQVLDDNKSPLNLSICKDSDIEIVHAIKNSSKIDISYLSSFQKLGVDILNINDSFFNYICQSYSNSNNDITLKDRIKDIYQNYSLCNDECVYKGINLELMTISCNCHVKENLDINETSLTSKKFDEIKVDSNFGIIKCYNLVFSFKGKLNNYGFWIFLFLVVCYIPLLILYFSKGIKPITEYIFKEMEKHGYLNNKKEEIIHNRKNIHFPPKKVIKISKNKNKNYANSKKVKKGIISKNVLKQSHKEIDNKIFISSQEESDFKVKNINSILTQVKEKEEKGNNEIDKNIIGFNLININLNNIHKEYIPENSHHILNNYTFEEAIKYDMRSICAIFYIFLLSKEPICHAFLYKSPFELFPLRICFLIFIVSSDLALNAFFYLDDKISKKYKSAQNLFLFAFSSNITIILLSTLIGFLFMTLFTNLSNSTIAIRDIFRKEEKNLKKNKHYIVTEERKKEIISEIKKILNKHKIKIIILIILEIIFILFFWYYVTAFCHVFSCTQTSWLFDSFLSILSRLVIILLSSLLFAKLYRIAVESNVHCLYKIALFFYSFG